MGENGHERTGFPHGRGGSEGPTLFSTRRQSEGEIRVVRLSTRRLVRRNFTPETSGVILLLNSEQFKRVNKIT